MEHQYEPEVAQTDLANYVAPANDVAQSDLANYVAPANDVAQPDAQALVPQSAVSSAREGSYDAFASAVLDACGLLAADFPECPHLAAAYSRLVAQCAEGVEAKVRLGQEFVAKFGTLIKRAANNCDDAVLESVFELDEAKVVDLRAKYYEYGEASRACLVAHLQTVCRLASCANLIQQTTAMFPTQLMDMAEEMGRTMRDSTDMGQVLGASIPKAFAMVSAMSEDEQNGFASMVQKLGFSCEGGSGEASSTSTGQPGMDLGGMVSMMHQLFGSFNKV